ncbi:MAG TPA: hypothetical protein PKO06_21375 [Candidatus Ozemobacteraceae bacterium]|nr:hypothetical protein [Candidatus Ozemobacteraceae bacterium]
MNQPQPLEVRLSRLCTAVLGAVGLLFFLVGLDLAYFRFLFDFTIGEDKKLIFYAFLFFANICGGLIFVQMVWYFLLPPLALRVDEKGITFATGFRYTPCFIEGKHVKSVGRGVTVDLTNKVDFLDVVVITFEPSPDIPSWKATPPGIQYFQHELSLSWFYRDTSSFRIIDAVNGYLNAHIWSNKGLFFNAVASTPTKNTTSLPG